MCVCVTCVCVLTGNNHASIGICSPSCSVATYLGDQPGGLAWSALGTMRMNGSPSTPSCGKATFAPNDVITVILDTQQQRACWLCNGKVVHEEADVPKTCRFAVGGSRGSSVELKSSYLRNSRIAASLLPGSCIIASECDGSPWLRATVVESQDSSDAVVHVVFEGSAATVAVPTARTKYRRPLLMQVSAHSCALLASHAHGESAQHMRIDAVEDPMDVSIEPSLPAAPASPLIPDALPPRPEVNVLLRMLPPARADRDRPIGYVGSSGGSRADLANQRRVAIEITNSSASPAKLASLHDGQVVYLDVLPAAAEARAYLAVPGSKLLIERENGVREHFLV